MTDGCKKTTQSQRREMGVGREREEERRKWKEKGVFVSIQASQPNPNRKSLSPPMSNPLTTHHITQKLDIESLKGTGLSFLSCWLKLSKKCQNCFTFPVIIGGFVGDKTDVCCKSCFRSAENLPKANSELEVYVESQKYVKSFKLGKILAVEVVWSGVRQCWRSRWRCLIDLRPLLTTTKLRSLLAGSLTDLCLHTRGKQVLPLEFSGCIHCLPNCNDHAHVFIMVNRGGWHESWWSSIWDHGLKRGPTSMSVLPFW